MHRISRAVLATLIAGAYVEAAGGSTILVTQTADPFGSDGLCSLREAMFAAGYNLAIDGCPAGDPGLDTIQLGAGTYPLRATISLSGVDPFILAGVAIGTTTIAPTSGEHRRLFLFQNATTATIHDLTLRDGDAWSATSSARGGAIRAVDSDLTLRLVNFQGNRASLGGALSFEAATAGSDLRVTQCSFIQNTADEATEVAGAVGGGAFVELEAAGSSARIADTYFVSNEANGQFGFEIGGGGLALRLAGGTSAEVLRSLIANNGAAATGTWNGVGGVSAQLESDAALRLVDDHFTGNWVVGSSASNATALDVNAADGTFELDRSSFESEDQGTANRHVSISAGAAEVALTNLLIANGPEVGLFVGVGTPASVRLGHITITNHAVRGLWIVAYGSSWLENSILWQNGVELVFGGSTPTTQTANLVGIDPQFGNPATGDFTLAPSSPAVDSGSDLVATMRFADALPAPRKIGVHTDRGAFERNGIFADDFDSADTGAWSAAVQ